MPQTTQKELYKSLVLHFDGQTETSNALKISQPLVSRYVNGLVEMTASVALRAGEVTKGKFKPSDLCSKLKEFKGVTIE